MSNEEMQKRILGLENIVNLFVKPNKYFFQRDVGVMTNKKLTTDVGSLIGFFGATPVVQPTTQGTVDHVIVGGTAIKDQDTFGNGAGGNYYTFSDIVKALEAVGILK